MLVRGVAVRNKDDHERSRQTIRPEQTQKLKLLFFNFVALAHFRTSFFEIHGTFEQKRCYGREQLMGASTRYGSHGASQHGTLLCASFVRNLRLYSPLQLVSAASIEDEYGDVSAGCTIQRTLHSGTNRQASVLP